MISPPSLLKVVNKWSQICRQLRSSTANTNLYMSTACLQTCHKLGDFYKCLLSYKFAIVNLSLSHTFKFLRSDKRACLENPCKNAGTCTELGQGDYTCTCAVGSKGKACECKCCSFFILHPFYPLAFLKNVMFHLIFAFLLHGVSIF